MQSSQPTFPNCASEAIEFLGRIQAQGFLLIADAGTHRILHASENAATQMGYPTGHLWEMTLPDLLPPAWMEAVRATPAGSNQTLPPREAPFHGGGMLHAEEDLLMIEAEDPQAGPDIDHLYRTWRSRIQACESEAELSPTLVEGIDALLGLKRTMLYRFEPDQSGVVRAEILHGDGQPYLGLRFPAGDIPDNARKLYLRNPVRLIFDVEGATLPVLSAPGQSVPNLQHSLLRAVAPVHIQYLKNMGVRSAISFPIVIRDTLWGLLSGHHDAPLTLSPARRNAAWQLVEAFRLQWSQLQLTARMQILDSRRSHIQRWTQQLAVPWPSGMPERAAQNWCDTTGAEALAVFHQGVWHTLGPCPEIEALQAITARLPSGGHFGTWHTDCLATLHPDFQEMSPRSAGLLALWSGTGFADQIVMLWFRPEWVREVEWGGMPPEETDGPKLGPRSSFEIWRGEMRMHSRPWEPEVLNMIQALLIAWNKHLSGSL